MSPTLSLLACAHALTVSAVEAFRAPQHLDGVAFGAAYVVDTARVGRRLDGFGAISGGGATSRLLFQYEEPYLTHILDYLFLPTFGASLHHLKVEVGGDGQSSEGTEPSHAHFEGDAVFTRGYEWRLMVEARRRNPAILISALAWTWPWWVGANSTSPWNDPPRAASYLVAWVTAARDVYNCTIDYVDADWNERGWSPAFVLALREKLDTAGFSSVGIVCGDDAHSWSCASAVAANATLRDAVVAIGVHGPSAPDPVAVATGVPMWSSETHVTDPGGTDLALIFSEGYATYNMTGYLIWNVLSSYNPALFSPDWGLFRAWSPWCNNYVIDGKVWVLAHYTQATAPGDHFISHDAGGTGNFSGGGIWIALVRNETGFTLVATKPATATAEVAVFTLTGPAAGMSSLFAVRSRVVAGCSTSCLDDYFLVQEPIAVSGGTFSLSLEPGDLWTLTTAPTLVKGARPAPPPLVPFPRSWSDDFDGCPTTQEAPYFTDMTGVFECVVDTATPSRGTVMRQVVPHKPLTWRPDEQRPFSVFASDISWADVDVSVDARLAAATDSVLIGVRANPNNCAVCGRVITAEDLMPGAWLSVSSAGWAIYNAIVNVTTTNGVLAKGDLPPPTPDAWHTLRLVVRGSALSAFFDGALLAAGVDVSSVPETGFVGFGTGAWGMFVDFDRFNVSAL